MAPRPNPRDADGWCVPQEGTVRYVVYLMAKTGHPPREIAVELDMKGSTVRQHIWAMRHPETHSRLTNPYIARARRLIQLGHTS